MSRDGFQWALKKSGPPNLIKRSAKTEYPEHQRASDVYTHWISGSTEDEIAKFFDLDLETVERDLQHIKSVLPTRTIVSHYNDRQRILLLREESEKFRKLLGDALGISAHDYIAAGLSPQPILKEFREAVGMVEKPGSFAIVQQQVTVNSGVSSSEDVLRRVLETMEAERSNIVDAEAREVEPEVPQPAETEEAAAEPGEDVPDPDDY